MSRRRRAGRGDRRLAQARRHLRHRPGQGRGPAAARAGAARSRRHRRLLRAGARRARAGRQREGRRRGRSPASTASASASTRRPVRISAETNGQPKFLCDISYFRFGDGSPPGPATRATFVEFGARSPARPPPRRGRRARVVDQVLAGRGGAEGAYDLPPRRRRRHDLRADPRRGRRRQPRLRDSPWDPIARYLPICGPGRAQLVTPTHSPPHHRTPGRSTPTPSAFADVIGGSRWPGRRGDRCRHDRHHRIEVSAMGATTDRYVVISADCHGGASIAGYKPFLASRPRRLRPLGRRVREPRRHRGTPTATGARRPAAGDGGRRRRRRDLPQHRPAVLPQGLARDSRRAPRTATSSSAGPASRRTTGGWPTSAARRRAAAPASPRSCSTTSTRRCARSSGPGPTGSPARPPARRAAGLGRPPLYARTTSPSGTRARTSACRSRTTAAARCPTWGPTPRPR